MKWILELFAIVGACFTYFTIRVFFITPRTAEGKRLLEQQKTDPAMKERDDYAQGLLIEMWLYIGLVIVLWILTVILSLVWKTLFS